ncbi:hypothetical protein ACTJJ7_16250 [Phyllobacterium sp. 22229]|uniref:hypothetical protein n=1 Tax=Phyllobacterium sp. 22229 TaxID=3453895 RepID=UPI003F847501
MKFHFFDDGPDPMLAMECQIATAIIGSAVVGAGASVAGSMAQSSATSKASKAQQDAQKYAADIQKDMYDTTRGDLLPYNTAGQNATNMLTNRLPELTAPIRMDQSTLEQTPGYQFNLSQGLKSVQNSAAARGLGTSGAALKGAASYATGLADSTYQNQFNNAVTNQTNAYNRLMGVSTLGENAAAQTGAYGTQTASNIGNGAITTAGNIGGNIRAGGTAIAAGMTGAANSLTNGVNGLVTYNGIYPNQNNLLGGI